MIDRMPYAVWSPLSKRLAVESWVMEASDCMVGVDVSRPHAERLLALSDTPGGDPNGGHTDKNVYQFRNHEHHMGVALIALQQLGYVVAKQDEYEGLLELETAIKSGGSTELAKAFDALRAARR